MVLTMPTTPAPPADRVSSTLGGNAACLQITPHAPPVPHRTAGVRGIEPNLGLGV